MITGKRVLVVAGTGMLRGVCLALAKHNQVSVVARAGPRLRLLAARPKITPIAVDLTQTAPAMTALRQACREQAFQHAIIWMPKTTGHTLHQMIPMLTASKCHVTLVRSHFSADPDAAPSQFEHHQGLNEVILGFIVTKESTRWLTHSEICAGVLAGAETRLPLTIGHVRPWESRPPE